MSQAFELKKVLLPGICAALLLSACGGGGGGGGGDDRPPSEPPVVEPPEDTSSGNDDFTGEGVNKDFWGENAILKAGVYEATVNYTDEREALVGPMLLSATGNFTFPFDADSITSGTLALEFTDEVGSNIAGPVVEYELFDTWVRSTGTIVGVVLSGSNDSAALDTGALVDSINIRRDSDASDQSLSFQQIAGTYETAAGSDPQITIDVDGGINGVDRGCILQGQITIPVPEINVYELSYKASGCTDLPEATALQREEDKYLGVGTFIPAADSAGGEGIEFAASNGKVGEVAFYFAGKKVD